jgi:hypothetical protein
MELVSSAVIEGSFYESWLGKFLIRLSTFACSASLLWTWRMRSPAIVRMPSRCISSPRKSTTVGDWRVRPDGLHTFISRMSDQRYEFLVAAHEMIEAYLAIHAGVSPEAVDRVRQDLRGQAKVRRRQRAG